MLENVNLDNIPEGSDKGPRSSNLRFKALVSRRQPLAKSKQWTLPQEIAQEIEATCAIKQKTITAQLLLKYTIDEIERRYKDNPELMEVLIEIAPTFRTLQQQRLREEWKKEVWDIIKSSGLFTADKRSTLIDNLYEQATAKGNVNAAKVWLTLSGDYVEKSETATKDIDTYREIQQAILGKK